jgi:putative endonuclease
LYYTYILKSLRDGSYYYGSTEDINHRLDEHNSGKMRYSKGHLTYAIHYFETFSSRNEAIKRERFFKSMEGFKWLKEKGIT